MLKLEKTEVFGWDAAIRGMRNPLNSWAKSDSYFTHVRDVVTDHIANFEFFLGNNDHELMMKLVKAGSTHAKFRRMINVTVDIIAPLYWWKEFDTYKVGTVANSCSTMHKIHDKVFTLDDFSHEHLNADGLRALNYIISTLNICRSIYVDGFKGVPGDDVRDVAPKDKRYWYQMIQLLPTSYNQKRTVQLNYEVLAAIYRDRRNHKLDEWHVLCDWIKELPYSGIITGEK